MKKMLMLIYNEFIKTYKRLSIIVLTAILLLFSIAIPSLMHIASVYSGQSDWSYMIKYIQKEKDRLHDDGSLRYSLTFQYYDLYHEMMAENGKYSQYDFRSSLSEQIYQNKMQALFLKACADTKDVEGIHDIYYKINYTYGDMFFFENDIPYGDAYYSYSEGNSKFITPEKAQELYDKLMEENEKLQKQLDINDYQVYTLSKIEQNENMLKGLKEGLSSDGNQSGESDETHKIEIELQIKALEEVGKILLYRYNENINYDGGNWRNRAILELENTWLYTEMYREPLTEEEYFKTDESMWRDYDEYLYYANMYKNENEKTYYTAKYSLEHDIPQPAHLTQSTRSYFDSVYIYSLFIGVLMAILAGSIVSSEYSTGTIRLLMLRPVTRTKIIISKIALVILSLIGTFAAMFVVHALVSASLGGFGDLNIPALIYKGGGEVIEQNFIISILPKIFICLSNALFIASLSFFVSTAMKNTAFASGLGLLTYLALIPVMIIVQLGLVGAWFAKLPFLYFNMAFLYSMGTTEFPTPRGSILIDFKLGAMEMVLLSAVLLILSVIVFRERDIKS